MVRYLAVDVNVEAAPGPLLDVTHVLEQQVQALGPRQLAHEVRAFLEPPRDGAVANGQVLAVAGRRGLLQRDVS